MARGRFLRSLLVTQLTYWVFVINRGGGGTYSIPKALVLQIFPFLTVQETQRRQKHQRITSVLNYIFRHASLSRHWELVVFQRNSETHLTS